MPAGRKRTSVLIWKRGSSCSVLITHGSSAPRLVKWHYRLLTKLRWLPDNVSLKRKGRAINLARPFLYLPEEPVKYKTCHRPKKNTQPATSVLEGLEAVRKRPGMYIGSTDSRGLMHCAWEIIDNAVDEATEGFATSISITLHPDTSVEVSDDGRGIPVDEVPGTGASGVEVVYTKLHAGGKFGGGSYSSSGGLHGVGASVVNALSQRLDVAVKRNGKVHEISFQRGEPGMFDDSGNPSPDATFKPALDESPLRITGKVAKKTTGTRVRYWYDPQIFPSDSQFSYDALIERVREKAFLVPGLTIRVSDLRGEEPVEEEFTYNGGVVDFVDFLASDPAVTSTMHLTGEGTFTETVQVLDKKSGHLKASDVERTCVVDIALRWGSGYETIEESFVNIIATPKGGTHVTGFEQGLVKVLRTAIDQNHVS